MALRITHREHAIEFDEATEIWSCGDLGLADKSLAKLKKLVDRDSKKMRRMRVPALLVYAHWKEEATIRAVTITLLREGGRSAQVEWTDSDGDERKERVDVHDLYGPDLREEIVAYQEKRRAADAAEEIADAAWAEIDQRRMSAERIREIVVQQAEEKL